jgi:hypothetical protein
MSTLEKLSAHTKRWNIKADENTSFLKFKSRIRLQLDSIVYEWRDNFWQAFAKRFNILLGYQAIPKPEHNSFQEGFLELISSSPNIEELAHNLQLSFFTIEDLRGDNNQGYIQGLDTISEQLFNILASALELTPQIGVTISNSKNEVILYPKGAKLLDEVVINHNLLWLESHPSVLKRFEQALAHYMSGDKNKYRNLLDDLRVALEQLLKDVLKNGKPLEKQKTELLPWLKTRGIHKQVINRYNTLLDQYTQFQNDAVKHQKGEEEFTESDIEFIIYTTGTFMRLLLKLEQNGHIITS